MKYTNILFDLDGTLTDSGEGIRNSIVYALEKMEAVVPPRDKLDLFIGPPLLYSFEHYCGMSPESALIALKYYREYFTRKGMFENHVYDGITEMLDILKKSGKHLFVATSKPEEFSRTILDHFGLTKYFDFIGGSTLDETRTSKDEVITYVLNGIPEISLENTVMVGDREHDVKGAKKNNIDVIGVLFGFGSQKELEEAGADYIAGTVEELKSILL